MDPIELPDGDLLTPLSVYLRLRGQGPSFLLESVEQGRLGRYSLVGRGRRLLDLDAAERHEGPVVGYLAYDHVTRLEPTVSLPPTGPDWPESQFVVPDVLIRFDHPQGRVEALVGEPAEVAALLAGPLRHPSAASPVGVEWRSPAAEYEAAVGQAQEHIRLGDAFQIVLSQRHERPTSASALSLYRALRRVNPSPYMFLLELDDLALVGSSPETLVKCQAERASLNPIAGSTPAGDGDDERLLGSEKDRAEHMMLVDLGRNDLARVCQAGSVVVERLLAVERYSHISHLVSEVSGRLRQGVSPWDLLRAAFPAGTVSGAPKVRAMQIISALEGHRRGIYAGAVLYHLPQEGTFDACIAIRTAVLSAGRAYLQAGAGVVQDSVPEAEQRECRQKLAALELALDLAEAS